jgi:serine/threonine protein kinase
MTEHRSQQPGNLGNYRVMRLIGQGGFADVYLGEHIHLRTQAAIKVLQMRLGGNSIGSFLAEARTIAHLVHPNIIRVLDFGVQNNIPFLVMDYAPKGTFRQRFLQERPRALSQLVPYIKQAAEALQYAHDNNFIHRDVKPENMLLGPNDEILLSDFGLALMAHNSSSRARTETAGTAAYMAPEQLQGRPRPASDQYALGVITYEWLSGSCPFVGSFFEIASQQVLGKPEPLYNRVAGISRQIEQVVFTALAKDPLRRYPNVKAFAQALEQACASEQTPGVSLVSTSFDAVAFIRENTKRDTDSRLPMKRPVLPRTSGAMPAVDQTLRLNGPKSGTPTSSQKEEMTGRMQSFDRSKNFNAPNGSRDETGSMRALPAPRVDAITGTRPIVSPGNEGKQAERNTRTRQLASMPAMPTYEEYMNRAMQKTGQTAQGNQASLSASSAQLPSSFQQRQSDPRHASNSVSNISGIYAPNAMVPPPMLPPLEEPESMNALSSFSANSESFPAPPPLPPALRIEQEKRANSFASLSSSTGRFMPEAAAKDEANDIRASSAAHRFSREAGQGLRSGLRTGGLSSWGPGRIVLIIAVVIIVLAMVLGIIVLKRPATEQNSGFSGSTAAATSVNKRTTRVAGQPTTVANPYVPNTGTLVFNDSLLQNTNGWLVGAADGGSCRFTDVGYQIYATLTTPPAVCFASTSNFSDFTYEVTMKFSTIGLKYSGGGIAFRANVAIDSFYFFEVLDNKSYSLQSCLNHVCKPVVGLTNAAQQFPFIHTGNDAENKIAVVAKGNIFTFYVNGQVVTRYMDAGDVNISGSIGVMATEGYDVATNVQQPTTAIFTNARVWG